MQFLFNSLCIPHPCKSMRISHRSCYTNRCLTEACVRLESTHWVSLTDIWSSAGGSPGSQFNPWSPCYNSNGHENCNTSSFSWRLRSAYRIAKKPLRGRGALLGSGPNCRYDGFSQLSPHNTQCVICMLFKGHSGVIISITLTHLDLHNIWLDLHNITHLDPGTRDLGVQSELRKIRVWQTVTLLPLVPVLFQLAIPKSDVLRKLVFTTSLWAD